MFIIKIIFFDTETTGLNCIDCKIIELAMLTVEDGEIIEEYDKFVNVGEPLSEKVKTLTGINDDMLINEGVDEKTVANDLKERLTEGTLMIAHNCQFDLQFVYYLLKRHFPDEALDIVSNVNWIDTVSVLKDRKDYPHTLTDAINYYDTDEFNYKRSIDKNHHYDIDKISFHRAIDDTKALYEVTWAMKVERNDLKGYFNLFGYNPKYGIGGKEFRFITYKRQPYHNRGFLPPERTLPRM